MRTVEMSLTTCILCSPEAGRNVLSELATSQWISVPVIPAISRTSVLELTMIPLLTTLNKTFLDGFIV